MTHDACIQLENSYLTLPESFYANALPVKVRDPALLIFNDELAEELGLDFSGMTQDQRALWLAGSLISEHSKPVALAYAGHQFGHFTMLGDGRAHLLGEFISRSGVRFDIQLKGSGPTPYSRRGDGLAVVGPMLREYLISEAMSALGIATTRSLAVVSTGQPVYRETLLPGAVLSRVAASHLRVGTFEFAAAHHDDSLVQALLDYTIHRHCIDLVDADNRALALLDRTIEKQASLIVDWMRVGFVHGVMNTDNMTLSGETIDYGPCAFMDAYNPGTVFSSIDHQGRYAYANQPAIALWNLTRLAEALLPLIHPQTDRAVALAEESLNRFTLIYREKWLSMMRQKLGLYSELDGDLQLITELLNWMKRHHADYTNTFLALGQEGQPTGQPYEEKAFIAWHGCWRERQKQDGRSVEDSQKLMNQSNPSVIPRNHLVEAALASAMDGDMTLFRELLIVLKNPYRVFDSRCSYHSPPPQAGERYQTYCGT